MASPDMWNPGKSTRHFSIAVIAAGMLFLQSKAEAAGFVEDWRTLDPIPPTADDGVPDRLPPVTNGGGIPMPGPLIEPPAASGPPEPGDAVAPGDLSAPGDEPPTEPLDILRDLSLLPEPVARMRQLIIEAAETGDIEALRPLLGLRSTQTQLAISGTDGDPVDYLRSTSGDGEGQETLAIILDLFNTGFVARQYEDEDTVYVWPYFFYADIATLTPVQRVELFRVVTAGDYQDMLAYGGYNFYRIGITASGEWTFFVAGD
jgi:hypothetical protein